MNKMGKRENIVQAALELFVEKGFHGTPIIAIVKRAGVGTGTIYLYFSSKDEANLLMRLWGVLYGLLLVFPFASCADEVSPFYHPAPPAIGQMILAPSKTNIWVKGIGEGFRSGTQILGFDVGAAYGMLMFGGRERHHLVLGTVSYGQMIRDTKGNESWYRGNWEWRGELFGGMQINSERADTAGIAQHLRYNFATGTRWIPYVDAGAGITLTEIRAPDLGGAFQFNLQAITGVNYFVSDDLALHLEGRYLHLSSSAISMPNNGVNTLGASLGINVFF